MEEAMRMDQDLVAKPSFTLATSRQPEKLSLCISYKMAGLGAVLMATVFRTPLICPTGLEYSWPVRKQRFIHQLPQRWFPVQQRQRLPGQEALCTRRLKSYQICSMRWLRSWQRLTRRIRTLTTQRLQR